MSNQPMKRIRRIIITKTIVYDRETVEKQPGINNDEDFIAYVADNYDKDFEDKSLCTVDTALLKDD